MSEEAGFLAAIISEPSEDTPRLVYADWLEENGRPEHAEFIRAQCELARLRYDDDRVSDLQARELRLLARHGAGWRGEGRYVVRFGRGMVEEWQYVGPERFAADGPALFARHPVREVEIGSQDLPGWGRTVAACPHLSRVETLRLTQQRSHHTDFSDFLAILSSPHLTGMTTLDASGGHGSGGEYGDAALFELLGPAGRSPRGRGVRRRGVASRAGAGMLPSLRNLRRLSLSDFGLTDRGLRMLLDSPLADTLTHLDLSRNSPGHHRTGITPDGIRALTASALWGRLESLNLAFLLLTDPAAVRELVEALPRSPIRVLGLAAVTQRGEATEALFEALAAAESWGRVETLSLSHVQRGPADTRALLQCPHLGQLRRLHLSTFDALTPATTRALADCPHLAGLTALVIGDTAFADDGMEALARSPYLTRLVYLDVMGTTVGEAGAAAFARSPNAGRLRILAGAGFGDGAMTAIAESPHLGRLTTLWLYGPAVGGAKLGRATDAGARALARSPNLPNLAVVHQYWQHVTEAGFRELIAREGLVSHGWSMQAQLSAELNRALAEKCPGLVGLDPVSRLLPLPVFEWSRYSFE